MTEHRIIGVVTDVDFDTCEPIGPNMAVCSCGVRFETEHERPEDVPPHADKVES